MSLMSREPVLVLLGGLATVVSVILGALVAVDVIAWDLDQIAAVVAAVAAVTALLIGVIRASVVAPATAERQVVEASNAYVDLGRMEMTTEAILDVDELATAISARLALDGRTTD